LSQLLLQEPSLLPALRASLHALNYAHYLYLVSVGCSQLDPLATGDIRSVAHELTVPDLPSEGLQLGGGLQTGARPLLLPPPLQKGLEGLPLPGVLEGRDQRVQVFRELPLVLRDKRGGLAHG
jgi:hypothetical protein